MRRCARLLALVSLTVAPFATASGVLGPRTARRAVVQKLERYQGFRSVSADCHRRSAREQRCTWSGRRPDGRWRGHATVRRLSGGSIDVRITSAHRV